MLRPLTVIQASIRLGKLEIKFCMYSCGVSCHSAISKLDSSCRVSGGTGGTASEFLLEHTISKCIALQCNNQIKVAGKTNDK
jgi:hypothetical protein